MRKLTLHSSMYDAIMNHDYSGLNKTDISYLNNMLLANGVSFIDCHKCSEPETRLISGAWCEVIDFYFKGA